MANVGNAVPTIEKLSTPHSEQRLIDMRSAGTKPYMKTAKPIDATTLKAKIAAFVRQNPDAPVFVAAPGVTEYQTVIDTMVLLQKAGAPKVALMTQPPSNAR